jgi:hypothetical protein
MRTGLIVLQAAGAISILPYPFVFLANVMSIAGEGPRGLQRLVMAAPYVLLSLYPLVWIGLDAWSWRLMGRGGTGWAFLLSAVPVVLSAAGAGWFFASDGPAREHYATEARATQTRIEPANPLVWTLLCAGGSRRLAEAPRVTIDEALTAIQQSERLNDPAPDYGTPLQTALLNLDYNFDGSPRVSRTKDLERLVRALVARGARLGPKESLSLRNTWLLKRAAYDGPLTTRKENPLVWRILSGADPRGPYVVNGKQFTLEPGDIPLLNTSTRLDGTPLYTALRMRWTPVATSLVEAGARLSAEENLEPAAIVSLNALFEARPELRGVYGPHARE